MFLESFLFLYDIKFPIFVTIFMLFIKLDCHYGNKKGESR